MTYEQYEQELEKLNLTPGQLEDVEALYRSYLSTFGGTLKGAFKVRDSVISTLIRAKELNGGKL
jgi:hypothetical protein